MRKNLLLLVMVAFITASPGIWAQNWVYVTIVASEGPAEVLINDVLVGFAVPRLAVMAFPGEYELTVRKSGTGEHKQRITIHNSDMTVFAPLSIAQVKPPLPPPPLTPPAPLPPPPAPEPHFPRLVSVPAGRTAQNNGNIEVRHSFEVGQYEITNVEFLAFLNDPSSGVGRDGKLGAYRMFNIEHKDAQIKHDGAKFYIVPGTDSKGASIDLSNYPVVFVTWYGAAAYCNWLSRKAGLQPVYTKDLNSYHMDFFLDERVGSIEGYRLGLAVEWRYAARGGAQGRPTRFAGSDNGLEIGWFSENTRNTSGTSRLYNPSRDDWSGTMPVGKKLPNELGIYDMQGNVAEYLHDRSFRGDSYSSGVSMISLDYFSNAHPNNDNNITGFRIFRTAIGTPTLPSSQLSPSGVKPNDLSTSTSSFKASPNYRFVPLTGLVNLRAIVRSPDKFIIAGNGAIPYTSKDGLTWSVGPKVPVLHVTALAWGNGIYVATGDGGGLAVSRDGITWIAQNSGSRNHLASALWTGSQFIVTGQNGTILASQNGTNWITIPSGVSSHVMDIAQTKEGGTLVAVTYDGSALVSQSGASWRRISIGIGSGTIHGITASPSGFVTATSSNDGRVYFSPDGTNWREVYRGDGKAGFGALHWDGMNFILGCSGYVLISSDGQSWSKHPLPLDKGAGKSASGDGILVTVSGDGSGVFVSSMPTPSQALAAPALPPPPQNVPSSSPYTSPASGQIPSNLLGTLLTFSAQADPYFAHYLRLAADGRIEQTLLGDELPPPQLSRWRMNGNKLEFFDQAGILRFTLSLNRGSGWSQVWRVDPKVTDPQGWMRSPPELRIVQ